MDEPDLVPHRRLSTGEPPVEIDDLRRRHRDTSIDNEAARQRAELLAGCGDGPPSAR